MTRILKLMVISGLVGTLGIVGCGDDEVTGTGGTGGTGGVGGAAPICGEGESLDESFTTDTKLVICDGMGLIDVPFTVTLAVKPKDGVIGGMSTEYDVQVQFEIDEATVDSLGGFVQTAGISEYSTDVEDSEGEALVNVAGDVPCEIDFTEDTDGNSAAGPVIVTTPVVSQVWTAGASSLVIEAPDITLDIASPVPLPLSTKGDSPECVWDDDGFPTVTIPAAMP